MGLYDISKPLNTLKLLPHLAIDGVRQGDGILHDDEDGNNRKNHGGYTHYFRLLTLLSQIPQSPKDSHRGQKYASQIQFYLIRRSRPRGCGMEILSAVKAKIIRRPYGYMAGRTHNRFIHNFYYTS